MLQLATSLPNRGLGFLALQRRHEKTKFIPIGTMGGAWANFLIVRIPFTPTI